MFVEMKDEIEVCILFWFDCLSLFNQSTLPAHTLYRCRWKVS